MKRSTRVFLSTSLVFLGLSVACNVAFLGLGVTEARAGRIRLGHRNDLDLLYRVFQGIRRHYVEEEKAKEEDALVHGGVKGMIEALDDPYSRFMPPRDFSDMQTESQGEFGGLGIVIGMREGRVTVISPMSGTPAYKKGVEAGDIIVRVDGEPIEGMGLQEVVDILRGKVGTKVKVTFYRHSLRKLLEIEIVRDRIPLPSIRHAFFEGGIGYLYAPGFTQKTGPDIQEKLDEWSARELEGVILDLRSNPGGLLEAAVAVGKLLLDRGTIVSVKDREGTENTFRAVRATYPRFPLVVLINEGSASASEIVAGAVKDHGRGLLVGAKTFGKGSVQTVLPLPDGSAMALTTAYYYTPSGALIHKKGIPPHIPVDARALATDELIELRNLRAALFEEPTLEKKEEMTADEVYAQLAPLDPQLEAAVELLRGARKLESLGGDGGAPSGAPVGTPALDPTGRR